jgi:hypothetical protein
MTTFLTALFVLGWVSAAILGSLTYFLGEQSKPIHARNWRSNSFAQLSEALTGRPISYGDRVPAFVVADAYASRNLSNR